jgi:hypothetical protein
MVAAESDPKTRRMSLWRIVSRFVAMSAESLASPQPGSSASSIRSYVGSFTRAVLPEIWATIVLIIRALSRSFWTTKAGRTLAPPDVYG